MKRFTVSVLNGIQTLFSNIQLFGKDSAGLSKAVGVDGDALKFTHSTHFPSARNETSTEIDYLRALSTGTGTRANTGITETVITASPAVLLAIIGNDANAGYSAFRNAATVGGGSVPIAQPNVADGASINVGIEFDTGITIQGELAAHDVTIIWAVL